jgi:8-oxo-dGTP pyrophosphatase MutT (NUDIX family)
LACALGRPGVSREDFLAELEAYRAVDEREGAMADRLAGFVRAHADCFERGLRVGHVTASAWVVDESGTIALLTHHRKLGRWLQLGGHADGDDDVRRVALREAREESGLSTVRFAQLGIYDLDVHAIPAHGTDPAHEHFDVRFAFFADPAEPLTVSDESHELAWFQIAALAGEAIDESVRRLARKTPTLRLGPPA